MAKSRAQRKAEQRRRAERGEAADAGAESKAQHDTQVPESAGVFEAELAEQGADLEALRGRAGDPAAPAPSRADVGRPASGPDIPGSEAEGQPDLDAEPEPADRISRRARKAQERERKAAAKDSERRRAPREEVVEKRRGAVSGFIASCWAELKRVQWPDRETLIQASSITLIFIAVMAAYLGVIDAVFNWLVQRIL